MASGTGTLTPLAIKAAAPGKHFDGGGLFLLVTPVGRRYWRLKYRYAGKERLLAFGTFPEVTLAEARRRRDQARDLLRDDRDPGAERKAVKARAVLGAANTFGAIREEWLMRQQTALAPVTLAKAEWLFTFAAALDSRPIAEITSSEVLVVLRKIEAAGTHETARRVKQRIGQVFRYAIATGRAELDVTAGLRGALTTPTTKPRAAITDPVAMGALLRALDGYTGQPTTCAALRLAPMLFARPGELRAMEWGELDLDAGEWRIPAQRMKMREEHVVPLAIQAVAILRALHALTGPTATRRGRFCFPSLRTGDRPMSENTVNVALRALGFDKETMTGHGFRAMASTRLNEMGWSPDVIERQLAHAERNKVRAAYNRAQYMAERRRMMQAWADYLDGLRAGAKVVPIKRQLG